MGAVKLGSKTANNSNSMHIHVRYSALRQFVIKGHTLIVRVKSKHQHADFLARLSGTNALRIHRGIFVMRCDIVGWCYSTAR